jgi:hypothetical protein
MSTPFKLKSGNKPNKPEFFGFQKKVVKRLIEKAKSIFHIKSKEDALKVTGYSEEDIKK